MNEVSRKLTAVTMLAFTAGQSNGMPGTQPKVTRDVRKAIDVMRDGVIGACTGNASAVSPAQTLLNEFVCIDQKNGHEFIEFPKNSSSFGEAYFLEGSVGVGCSTFMALRHVLNSTQQMDCTFDEKNGTRFTPPLSLTFDHEGCECPEEGSAADNTVEEEVLSRAENTSRSTSNGSIDNGHIVVSGAQSSRSTSNILTLLLVAFIPMFGRV